MKHSAEQQDWVLVARVLRSRGNKGEVVAELFTDFPSRFDSAKEIHLRDGSGKVRPARLRSFWIDRNHPDMGIFHFEESASIDSAEKLRGLEVVIPFSERIVLPAGKYFVSDLIGCAVFETPAEASPLASPACDLSQAPRVLGTVKDVFFPGESTAGTPILQVETSSGELLLPLAEDICRKIDVAARRIDVTLPEGLSDLNSET